MFHPPQIMLHETFFVEDETFLLSGTGNSRVSEFFPTFLTGYNKINTKQYQRKAQELTDVQSHPHFLRNLRVLHEFQPETGTEKDDQ